MLKPDTAFPRDAEFLDYIRSFVDESRLSEAAVDRLFALARRGAEASEASNLRGMVRHHQDQTTALRAEVEKLRAENEKLRAALHEAADELDGYYRAEYFGDHPYSKRKLAEAMRQNPARAALEEK